MVILLMFVLFMVWFGVFCFFNEKVILVALSISRNAFLPLQTQKVSATLIKWIMIWVSETSELPLPQVIAHQMQILWSPAG